MVPGLAVKEDLLLMIDIAEWYLANINTYGTGRLLLEWIDDRYCYGTVCTIPVSYRYRTVGTTTNEWQDLRSFLSFRFQTVSMTKTIAPLMIRRMIDSGGTNESDVSDMRPPVTVDDFKNLSHTAHTPYR